MNINKTTFISLLVAFTQTSCFIVGIHTKIHNPSHAGKAPKFSERELLLAEKTPYRDCYDVHFYELDISFDPDKKQLEGMATTHAIATRDFDTLQLDLYENMNISSITFEVLKGKNMFDAVYSIEKAEFFRREGAVFIVPLKKVGIGEHFSVKVNYNGKPKVAKKPPWRGGFVWKKDKNKKPWIGVACETEGASLWWPCKDVTFDEADSVVLRYTVPKDLIAVGNGRKMGESASADGTKKTYTWKVSNPINTYNITAYVGNFVLIEDSMQGVNGTINMNHYVLPVNKEKARKHFQQVKPMINFFEKAFGSYPWYKDGFRLVESPYAGMEHQSAIAYGNQYKNYPFDFDYIILHETAHEWWGNSVTAADFADIWLQEGFATYAEALYQENTKNHNDYLAYMRFEQLFIKNKNPVVGIRNRRHFDYRDSDAYMKGSWILHTLRNTIGNDSLFRDIIKTFCIEHKAKLVTSGDFVNWVNDKTGEDYSWFFDQYLHERETPMLQYAINWKAETPVLTYKWGNVSGDFKLPVQLSYLDKNHKRRYVILLPTESAQKVSLEWLSENGVYLFDTYDKLYGIDEKKKIR